MNFLRLVIRAVKIRDRIRNYQIEMDIVTPVIICVIIGSNGAVWLFCIGVMIVNKILQ